MSSGPPPPFDPSTQTDYQGWYEMINSIVGFVTASTHLASTLRNSRCCFPETLQITEVIGDDEPDTYQVFNLVDFPWFLGELGKTYPHKTAELKVHKPVIAPAPLMQFPISHIAFGEPNNQPRTITLMDTKDFGDISRPPTTILNCNLSTAIAKSDPSNQSCYFEEYTDSEQTIDSTNLQENYDEPDQTPSINTSKNKLEVENLLEAEQMCTIYDSRNEKAVSQTDLILECDVEEILIVQQRYPKHSKTIERKDEGVETSGVCINKKNEESDKTSGKVKYLPEEDDKKCTFLAKDDSAEVDAAETIIDCWTEPHGTTGQSKINKVDFWKSFKDDEKKEEILKLDQSTANEKVEKKTSIDKPVQNDNSKTKIRNNCSIGGTEHLTEINGASKCVATSKQLFRTMTMHESVELLPTKVENGKKDAQKSVENQTSIMTIEHVDAGHQPFLPAKFITDQFNDNGAVSFEDEDFELSKSSRLLLLMNESEDTEQTLDKEFEAVKKALEWKNELISRFKKKCSLRIAESNAPDNFRYTPTPEFNHAEFKNFNSTQVNKAAKDRANTRHHNVKRTKVTRKELCIDKVDYVIKNIVDVQNRVIDGRQKREKAAALSTQSKLAKEKAGKIPRPSSPTGIKGAASVQKPPGKKSLSADTVKLHYLHPERSSLPRKPHAKKPVAHSASDKDKPFSATDGDLFKPLEIKSCLKSGMTNSKTPKTCIIKEPPSYAKRPASATGNTDMRGLPKLLSPIRDTRLKLTAAENVRRAAELLKSAEEKVLKPTSDVKMQVISGAIRPASSGSRNR